MNRKVKCTCKEDIADKPSTISSHSKEFTCFSMCTMHTGTGSNCRHLGTDSQPRFPPTSSSLHSTSSLRITKSFFVTTSQQSLCYTFTEETTTYIHTVVPILGSINILRLSFNPLFLWRQMTQSSLPYICTHICKELTTRHLLSWFLYCRLGQIWQGCLDNQVNLQLQHTPTTIW